ncbi:MAG TPA: proton-conducting transporter membrane subunit, partial [Acidimicrobiia bacterium]|nr:proton-conducting transporter membrane subunit [Acidimicrobiia bacterium]
MTTAGLASLLPLPVVAPLLGAVAAPLVARLSGRLALVAGTTALAVSTAVLALLAPDVYRGEALTHFMGHWGPVGGVALGVAFSADAWGLTYALAAAGVGAVLLVYTLSEQSDLGDRELGGLAALFLLLEAGLIGVALTADMINLFVWFEVAALASYALTAFFLERPLALEAAFKILVLTTIAGFAVFLGAALLYANHGATNFGQLHAALAGRPTSPDRIALGLLIAGLATKGGLVPFHGWLPDAHTAAPGPVSALFSGLMVGLGVVASARLTFEVFTPESARPLLGVLMVLGLVSALAGAVYALFQDELKRLLAYDTISQMGVILVGLATGEPSGLAGTAYHLLNHALFKSLLFLCAGAIVHRRGLTRLSDMGALGREAPLLAAAFVVGVAAIVGVPPFNGYASVGLIHDALRSSGQPVVLGLMLVAQTFTVAALGKAAWMAFFRHRDRTPEQHDSLRPGMRIGLVILGAACLGSGLVPNFLLHHVAGPAAGVLGDPAGTARVALGAHLRLTPAPVGFDYFSPSEL